MFKLNQSSAGMYSSQTILRLNFMIHKP